jgi:hypothetical protein
MIVHLPKNISMLNAALLIQAQRQPDWILSIGERQTNWGKLHRRVGYRNKKNN